MTVRRLRCAVYTRKSTEEGLEQDYNSLEAQRDACVSFIQSQAGEGWTVVKTQYDDGGLSGATMERPALKQLLADIEARRVDVVVVYKVDRLTRSLADFAKIVEILDAQDVSFVSVTQQFNTTSSMGRLTLNVLLSFAQFEREVTAERIRDKIAASKKKGMWMGGVVPIGYDVVDRKLVVNADEAETIRTLFDLYIRLGTVKAVKEETDRLGLRTKARKPNRGSRDGGGRFRIGHLHKLLTNCLYIGEIGHKGERYQGEHEPIVEKALWEAVQAKLGENAVKRRSESNAASLSLLTGLLRDENGITLKPSHASKSGRRYRYYISRQPENRSSETESGWRLPAPAIEGLVVQSIGALLDDAVQLTDTLSLTKLTASESKAMLACASQLTRRLETGNKAERRALLLEVVARIELRRNRVRIGLNATAMRTSLEMPDHTNALALEIA